MHPGMNPIEDPELKEAAKKCLEMIAVEQRYHQQSIQQEGKELREPGNADQANIHGSAGGSAWIEVLNVCT